MEVLTVRSSFIKLSLEETLPPEPPPVAESTLSTKVRLSPISIRSCPLGPIPTNVDLVKSQDAGAVNKNPESSMESSTVPSGFKTPATITISV